ncbi:MAG: hypothetical protein WC309_01620 [Candidatus Paceibacterota bacterium]|jgi:hypothetical protein
MDNKQIKATIIATGETIEVYRLSNGNYYDANAISNNKQPSAKKANKKEFAKSELSF